MKKILNIGNSNSVKPFKNTTVDKDVQSMFFPLNLMQCIILYPKYRIKENVITPNSLMSIFVSMVATLVFMLIFVHCTYVIGKNNESLDHTTFVFYYPFFNCTFVCFGLAMNFMIECFRTKSNVQFIVKFQKVHRFINNESDFNHIITWNWIIVLVYLGFYVIVLTYFYVKMGAPFDLVYASYFFIIFDFNIIYAIRVIRFLENKVVLWNILDFNSVEIDDMHEETYGSRMFQAYAQILECYDIFKHNFQEIILYYIIKAFIHILMNIKFIIDMLRIVMTVDDIEMIYLTTAFKFFWLIKNISLQTMLIQQCEKFYSAIQSAQDTCTLMLKSTCSENDRKLYKNLLRLHRASFSKICACGLFDVDADLQFNLMFLVTNYTVTLLQFTFL